MELQITSTEISEPVSIGEVKEFMGFSQTDTSQDATLSTMIATARKWLEDYTARSLTSKNYKARYEKDDADSEGYFELPVSPVTGTPSVNVNGTTVTYLSRGLEIIRIKPDNVYSTLSSDTDYYYCEVTFTAGAKNETRNLIICAIVADMFNNRNSENLISIGRLSYNIVRMIQSISLNVGL